MADVTTEVSIVGEAVKQVPALAVLCFIVWSFVKQAGKFAEVMRDLHKEHIDARAESREAINENTRAMQDNTQAMNHLVESIDSKCGKL
jgi:hypothetical protein